MIAWTIAQIALLGVLLAVAAYAAESGLRAAGRPTRWAWVGALVMLVVLAALAPMQAAMERTADAPVVLPAATTTTTVVAEPAGLLATLSSTWQEFTAAATRTAQQGWSAWHATMPAGIDRVLLMAWLIASVALLVVFATVHLRFQRRRAQWPAGTLHGTAVRIASDVGPAVIGVTSAEIVVPQWLLSRDDREQALVLAHEREHVRAHDPLLLALAQATIVLLPWHPAVWWMASRLRLAVELDCDRRVLQRGASARDYGTLLIDLTDHRTGFGAALPAFSCTPSHLERRLIAMTPKPLRYPLVRVLSTGALASLALLAACEAKLPTSEEVNAMTAKSATEAAAFATLVDSGSVRYFIDDIPSTKDQAEKLSAEQIATVNVLQKGTQSGGEVRIMTRTSNPGDSANPTRIMLRRTGPGTLSSPLQRTVVDSGRPDVVSMSPSGTVRVHASEQHRAFSGLLLIDGVVMAGNEMDKMSPDQIASVNVIKGPAATAKYSDPRAANGVIEIITKKAKP